MPKTRILTAAGASPALVWSGVAAAHQATFNTTITATTVEVGDTTVITGDINSPRAPCVPNRRVKLFHVDAGPDTFIASDRSNRTGRWQVNLGTSPRLGKYYGKATSRDIGPGAHKHVCQAATSNRATVVATKPTITIQNPDDGDTYTSSSSIPFVASASDPQDGDLSGSSIVWTSHLDGQIGTGESFQTTLSIGTHEITATATDSDGKTGTDTIGITVTS